MTTNEMRETVFRYSKQVYSEGLVAGSNGNLSLRDGEAVAITPSNIPYSDMTAEDIVIINLYGEVQSGKHKPSSENLMHLEIYRQRGDVNAVVHTHSTAASAFAVAGQSIPAALAEMIPYIFGDVPLAEYSMLGTDDVGKNALKVLRNRGACLLANHGVVAIGSTMEQAHSRAVCVEESAKICIAAATLNIAKNYAYVKPVSKKRQNELRRKFGIPEE